MTNIEIISKKCSNFKCIWTTRSKYGSSIALSTFQLDRNWFKFHLQRNFTDFFVMNNIEIISKKCSNFKCVWTTRSKYGSSIALSNFQLDRNWFKFYLQWYWTDFFEMTNIEMISKKCSNFKCIWTTRSKYGSSIAMSNFQLYRNWFKFHLQWNWTDFFVMTNIEIISKKCSNFKCIWTTRSKYGSSIAMSNFQLDRNWFKFHLQWNWTDFFVMTNIEIISKKCSNFKCIWTTRSKYWSSIALSNFQLDRNWFKFHLQWNWTDFFVMTNIEIISKKCSNFKYIWTTRSKYGSSIALSNFQLDRNWFKFHLQWYLTDFFEMTNIEMISKKCSNFKCIWTTRSKYGSSIALSNFQLDRNWFKFHLQWYWTDFFEMTNIEMISKKCSNFKCICTTRSKYGSSIAMSNFQLDR